MQVLLDSCRKRFCARIKIVASALRRSSLSRGAKRRIDRYSQNEGLVSSLWQMWSSFSRSAVLLSAGGAITASGDLTTSAFAHLQESQLLFVCRAAAFGQPVTSIRSLRGSYLEPSWGDAQKINRIVNRIRPTNANNLLTGFGLRSTSVDLQVVRNACAHMSSDNLEKIRQLQTRYADTRFSHPSDALFWTDPITGFEAWEVWIDELAASASAAVA